MTRSCVSRIAALIAVAVLASCAYDEYSIQLTPQDDVIHRELTVRRVGGEEDAAVPAEKLDAIAELYGQEVETDVEGGHAFVGEFADAMPSDVGGAGEYITFDTRMGQCSAYIERFRGNDSPAERIQAAFDAADELTDLLIGWLEGELGEYEDFPKLRAFLDEQLRSDLKNLSIASFLLDSTSSAQWAEDDSADRLKEEIIARAAQYLLEHEYVLPEEVPAIRRISTDSPPDGGEVAAIRPLLTNMLQRKAELPDEDMLAALGGILASSDSLEDSLVEYLITTEAYEQRLAEWEQLDDESPEPDPLHVLIAPAYATMLLDWDIFGTNDLVKVTLRDVPQPEMTNGRWDEDAQTVSWANRVNTGGLPAICYAVWAQPNVPFQTEHFGKVIVKDSDLLEYCLWRKSLTDQEAAEWDAIVDQLSPDDEYSIEALREFRFSLGPALPADDENTTEGDGSRIPPYVESAYARFIIENMMLDPVDGPVDDPTE